MFEDLYDASLANSEALGMEGKYYERGGITSDHDMYSGSDMELIAELLVNPEIMLIYHVKLDYCVNV